MKKQYVNDQFQTLVLFFSLLFSSTAFASSNITFQSKIVKPDGYPLESASVSFRMSVTDSVGTCVIFQEDFPARNMSGSKGLINLSLGAGTQVFPVPVMTMAEVFNNYNAPTLNCQAGGTINPGPTDIRKLVVQFNDGTGWQTVPAMAINSVPSSLQALTSQKLGDYPASDYLRIANVATCGGGQALHFNGTTFTCVGAGGAGAGTVTTVTSANADIGITNNTTTPELTLNVGTGNNQIVKLNGSAQLPAVSGVNLTALNASNLGSGTVPDARMPALTGDVTMTAGSTTTAIAAGVILDADINAAAAIARTKIAASTVGERGDVLINDGSGNLASLQCNNGEVIKFDGAGVAVCGTDTAGAAGFIDGGNTFAATATLGTNSNHNLELETNGTTKMTIEAGGDVGIGTTNPGAPLEVNGNILLSRSANRTISVATAAVNTAGNNLTVKAGDGGPLGMPPLGGIAGQLFLTGGEGTGGADIGGSVFIHGAIGSLGYGNVLLGHDNTAARGNVGVGTNDPRRILHVNGPMRITPTTVPASPAAGDMYVDSADSNKLKFYDGSGWVAAGGGGAGSVTNVSSANADIGVANGASTPTLTLNSSVAGAADKIVKLDGSGNFGAINAAALTDLNASALASGTVAAARMPALTGDVTMGAGTTTTTIAGNAVTSAKILDDEIVNADIKSNAAIARTKLASGTNNHVLINDGSGVMTSEAILAVSRGGTGLASYTNNALIMANGTGSGLTNATCNAGEILLWNSTTWACTDMAASGQGFFKNGGNTLAGTGTIGTNSNHNLEIETNSATRVTITNAGNVTIAAPTSGTALTVAGHIRQSSGQVTSAPHDNAAATAFDFNNGNVQYTSANCQAMTLSNMLDGGTYTIAVKGTVSGTCSFSHAGLNFWYSPAQGPSANGSQSTYTFVRMGSDVYVTWISLYQ